MSTPAWGRLAALPGRSIAIRAALLVGLLAVALAVRASGILQSGDANALPALPNAALVVPGVYRSGAPTETELVLMRDTFGTRGVVVAGAPSTEERAVAPVLGLRLLAVPVPDDGVPTAADLQRIRDLVRETRAAGATVLLHDATGTGPVVGTAALLAVLEGTVPDDTALTPAARTAVTDLTAALDGRATAGNPYATLTR
jgi:hypothetical protein